MVIAIAALMKAEACASCTIHRVVGSADYRPFLRPDHASCPAAAELDGDIEVHSASSSRLFCTWHHACSMPDARTSVPATSLKSLNSSSRNCSIRFSGGGMYLLRPLA